MFEGAPPVKPGPKPAYGFRARQTGYQRPQKNGTQGYFKLGVGAGRSSGKTFGGIAFTPALVFLLQEKKSGSAPTWDNLGCPVRGDSAGCAEAKDWSTNGEKHLAAVGGPFPRAA